MGLGLLGDRSGRRTRHDDETRTAARAGAGLRLYGGPGLTAKVPEPGSEVHAEGAPQEGGREAFFIIRGGAGWVAEVGRVSFMPQVELDFTREGGEWRTALVFGVSVGFGF
jgi:hypothetical protein